MEDNSSREIERRSLQKEVSSYSGVVLSDQQVLDLIMSEDPNEIGPVCKWLGLQIAKHDRPSRRYSQISDQYFDTLSKEDQEKFIKGSAAFVFSNFKQREQLIWGTYEVFGSFVSSEAIPEI